MKRVALFLAGMAIIGSLAACSEKKEANAPPAPAAGGKAAPAAKIVQGQPAPDFTLTDLAGKSHKLSDYRGKVVIVNFWATWCPPCREEIPSMMALDKKMAGKPFAMLCASIDEGGKEAVEGYYKTSGNRLPITLLDSSAAVAQLYGTTGVPESFVIDKNGIVLEKVVGGINWTDPQVVSYLNSAAAN
jgi:thiol-disulfide isomerase/thioredoxin